MYYFKKGGEKGKGKKIESRNGRNIISSHSVHGSYLHRMQRGHVLLNIPAVQSEKHEQIKDTAHLCLYFYTMKNLLFVWHYPSPFYGGIKNMNTLHMHKHN